MRNLKRALSLTLASVMLLGMMVVGSSAAAGYDDVKETDNVEAIEVLQTVGIMVGDERGFGPDRPVNRAEMAVVMGLLLNLDYNYYSATCPFNDVYDWARGWVGACAANGIVSGRGDGVYDPGATVTAVEAASMLMRALGYFKYASDYADGFEVSTVRQGTTIGIFKGVGSSAVEPMTRNQVAQMVLNTLRSGMVQPDGNTLNYFDNNGQVIATGGKINYVYVTSNDSFARSISRLEATSMGSPNGSPIVELGEQLYDGDLKLYGEGNSVADRVWDEFGRPARTWEYKGQEIGTYEKKELLKETYTAKVTGQTLYELLGKSTIDNYNFQIAIDGEYTTGVNNRGEVVAINEKTLRGAWFDQNDLYRNNKDAVGRTGNGVLTKVYVDTDFANPANYSVYIAIINTYLAKANEDYDSKNDDVSLRVWRLENDSTKAAPVYVKSVKDDPNYPDDYARTKEDFYDIDAKGEDFSIVKDVKKNDLYKVTVADGEIQTIEAPEILSAVTIDAFKLNDHVTTGGQQYDHATTARYDVEAIENWTGVADKLNLKELTYNVILDDYGYLLGLERNEDPNQYVFVTGIEKGASNLYAKQVDANVIFLDGTMDTVKIDMTKSSWGQPGAADQSLAGNRDGINLSQLNTWCTYTVNSNGVYTMKRVAVSTGSNIVNQDTNDNIKIGQFAQDVALFNDGASERANTWDTKSINTKRVSLKGSAGNDYVYGNDDTVYLAVSLEKVRVDDTTPVNVYDRDTKTYADDKLADYRWIVDDVDTVVTGVKNASLKATDLGKAKEGFGYPNAEIYSVYDEDGIVIAAVIIGEDDGASSTYAYIHSSGLEEESYASAEARANGEWTWTRKAIVNGVETLLKEVGDSPKYLSPDQVGDWGGMDQGQWYEIRYNADGNVRRAIEVPLDGKQLKYPVWVQNVEDSVNDSETVVLRDVTTPTALSYSGGTLYTNTDKTKGFSVDPDVKTVLILADRNGKKFDSTTDGYNGYTGLEQALREVNYKATNHTVIAGELEVSAIFNGGRATTIIINDYTPAPNNRPGGNGGSDQTTGNVTKAANENIEANGNTYGSITSTRLGNIDLKVTFKAPAWADKVNNNTQVKFKVTISDNMGAVAVLNETNFTKAIPNTDFTFTANSGLTNLENAIANGRIDGSQLKAVISDVVWTNAGVKYVYADGTTAIENGTGKQISGDGADGKAPTSLKIGSNNAEAFKFVFNATKAVADGYTVSNAKYAITGATAAADETTKTDGDIAATGNTTVTFTSGTDKGLYAGNGWVTVKITGVTKAPEPEVKKFSVTAGASVTGKVLFAVYDTDPNAAAITAVPAADWKTSLSEVPENKWVMVKSATNGVKLATMTAGDPAGVVSYTPAEIPTSTGVFKFQVTSNVIVGSITDDAPAIKKISIAPDGSQVNVMMDNGTFADDTAMFKAVVEFIEAGKVSGWSAELGKPNAAGVISTIDITNSVGTSTVNNSVVKVSATEITIDGTSYVMKDALGTVKLKEALEVAGVTVTNGSENLYVIANKNAVGTYTAGANIVGMATDAAAGMEAAVASGVNEIVTNNGKGYAKLAATAVTSTVTATGATDFKGGATFAAPTAALKNASSYIADAANIYAPIGTDMTITLTLVAPDQADRAPLTADATVAIEGNNLTLSKFGTATEINELKAGAEYKKDDTIDLTFQITGVGSGAAGSLGVTLADKV